MRINVAVPEEHVDAPVLDAALEAVTRLNESLLQRGEIPTFEKALQYGIKWRPEPPGDEHFDHGKEVFKRRWGDCDDLAPLHAASLRHTGEDPEAMAVAKRSGPKRWHAVVQRSDGTIDDPSRRAGMNAHEPGVVGATVPLMMTASVVGGAYIVRPQIAMRPMRGWVQARADLPWHWREHLEDPPTPSDYAMTTLHTAPVASTALTGAIMGAVELGESAGVSTDEHLDRLCALADAIDGATMMDLEEAYGPEAAKAAASVVGSFWSGLAKAATHAMPIAKMAVPFVPGIGPIAAQALEHPQLLRAGLKMIPGVGPVSARALDFAHEHFPALDKHSAAHQAVFHPGPDNSHTHHHFVHFS